MRRFERLEREYLEMRDKCALVTAADARYAPYLFNALLSIHANFPDHPLIYVFDLGLTAAQRRELGNVSWVKLKKVTQFIPHWKIGWSWKPYILTRLDERYLLYFDGANIVLYRSIKYWFLSIKNNGFFGISNRQILGDITPSGYWEIFGLDLKSHSNKPTFGAGLFGFDKEGPVGEAILKCLTLTLQGFTLGRSSDEKNPLYSNHSLRDCRCFRADQTLLNLAVLECMGDRFLIRDELRYCGLGGGNDHNRQYLWYSRRNRKSLIHFNNPLSDYSIYYFYNRLTGYSSIYLRWLGGCIFKFSRHLLYKIKNSLPL